MPMLKNKDRKRVKSIHSKPVTPKNTVKVQQLGCACPYGVGYAEGVRMFYGDD
jgi:hypothetical protein